MKNIIIVCLLLSSFGFGQFFGQDGNHEEGHENHQPPEEPDQGEEGPGNPGQDPVPLNQWIYLLPLAGYTVATYYFYLKNKREV